MPTRSTPPRSLRILVAEDVPIIRELAVTLLRNAGHSVDGVENGQAALSAVQATAYDAVLMDVYMPGMDGLEATAAIRALPTPTGDVPIIALTAEAIPSEAARFRAAGMDDHLVKPIDPKRIVAVVEQAAARRRQERS